MLGDKMPFALIEEKEVLEREFCLMHYEHLGHSIPHPCLENNCLPYLLPMWYDIIRVQPLTHILTFDEKEL